MCANEKDTQDNDAIVLQEAAETAAALDVQYRIALRTPGADFNTIGRKADEAMANYSKARLNLLREGVLAKDEDILEIRRIRMSIEKAATIQQAIAGAIKFIAFIAKFL